MGALVVAVGIATGLAYALVGRQTVRAPSQVATVAGGE
jgi:hypothetical protein